MLIVENYVLNTPVTSDVIPQNSNLLFMLLHFNCLILELRFYFGFSCSFVELVGYNTRAGMVQECMVQELAMALELVGLVKRYISVAE